MIHTEQRIERKPELSRDNLCLSFPLRLFDIVLDHKVLRYQVKGLTNTATNTNVCRQGNLDKNTASLLKKSIFILFSLKSE